MWYCAVPLLITVRYRVVPSAGKGWDGAGRRGAAVRASRYAAADQPADEPHRERRLSERRPATLDPAESRDPGGRPTRTDRSGSRRRAHYARDRRTRGAGLSGDARLS